MVNRLQSDQQFSAGGEKFRLDYVWQCLKDPKTYIASMWNSSFTTDGWMNVDFFPVGIYMGLYVLQAKIAFQIYHSLMETPSDGPLFAFSLFTPTIINEVSSL